MAFVPPSIVKMKLLQLQTQEVLAHSVHRYVLNKVMNVRAPGIRIVPFPVAKVRPRRAVTTAPQ
jgi:hypothetical protein